MLQDLRYAWRVLWKSPAVAVLAIMTVALGIGANAAIFTVVNGVLLRPLPYREAERLVFIRSDFRGEVNRPGLADAEILDIRSESHLIEGIAWMVNPSANLTTEGDMEHVTAATASDEFLPVLGVQPILGRGLIAKEDQGEEHVQNLLISYDLWRRRYNRDPNIIGRPIDINNFTATIIGVLPENFRMYAGSDADIPPQIDIWFPGEAGSGSRRYRDYNTIARLRTGVTLEQAQAEIDAIATRMIEQNPQFYPERDLRLRLVPLHQDLVKSVRPAILVLAGAVGFVLLIACANIANILLARAAGRRKEIAIRSAIGAGRARVVRQLLTESLMLALAGGGAGIVLALYLVDLLLYLRPEGLPRQDDIVLDTTVTLFAFGLSMLSGVLFGLVPAVHAARSDVNSALKDSGRSVAGTIGGNRIRLVLVVGQVALSLVLLIGAGLMIRSFANLRRVDLGFDASNLLTFKLEISPRAYPGDETKWRFYKRALETIRAYPGVLSVSGTGSLPLDRWEMMDVFALPENPEVLQPGLFSPIMPGYFATMRIPLTGRDFTEEDNDSGAAVAIVDEQFASRTWPGENAIGKRIFLRAQLRTRQLAEIVGIARHVQYGGLAEDRRPQIYLPYRNYPIVPSMTVRTSVDPLTIAAPLKKVVEGLGHRRPAWGIRTMDNLVADAMAETRFALVLLGVLSVVALVLSVIGVYGVMAYSIAERMTEFSIRMALGAQPNDILKVALGWGVKPAAAGIVIGLAAALALTRFLSGLLFGVRASDPLTYVSLSLLLLISTLCACYIPIRRRVLRADTRTFL